MHSMLAWASLSLLKLDDEKAQILFSALNHCIGRSEDEEEIIKAIYKRNNTIDDNVIFHVYSSLLKLLYSEGDENYPSGLDYVFDKSSFEYSLMESSHLMLENIQSLDQRTIL